MADLIQQKNIQVGNLKVIDSGSLVVPFPEPIAVSFTIGVTVVVIRFVFLIASEDQAVQYQINGDREGNSVTITCTGFEKAADGYGTPKLERFMAIGGAIGLIIFHLKKSPSQNVARFAYTIYQEGEIR